MGIDPLMTRSWVMQCHMMLAFVSLMKVATLQVIETSVLYFAGCFTAGEACIGISSGGQRNLQ